MPEFPAFEVHPGGRDFPPQELYRGIKLVVFDVDGVLTDGRIVLDSNGVETKFFDVRDGTGITLLQNAEIRVAILTGRSSSVVELRARELHISPGMVKQGAKIKLPVLSKLLAEMAIEPDEVAFVGDDLIDLPVLQIAGLSCCPADAHPEIIKVCHVVACGNGGRGAIRAICEHLLKRRGDGSWEKSLERYLGRI